MTKLYDFTLALSGVCDETEGLEDVLFEAGCDDALIYFRHGRAYLDFDRKAESLEDAVISAIKAVEKTPLNIKVESVAPDDYVSESEMAARLKLNRQAVSHWVKGTRCKGKAFPPPVMKLTAKSPLWRWAEVVEWLFENNKISDPEILISARFMECINIALIERDKKARAYKRKLLKRLL